MKLKIKFCFYLFLILIGLSEASIASNLINHPNLNLSEKTTESTKNIPHFSSLKDKSKSKNYYLSLQLGGFIGHQGTNQVIEINGTRGDYFSISRQNNSNALVGLGYYFNTKELEYVSFTYGLNAFYLARSKIIGTVTQEQLFTNLSYNYFITNWPIYFAIKTLVKNRNNNNHNLTLDIGIGPNIIRTSKFNEQPLLGSIIPDSIVAGQTTTNFTAMAGIGYRVNHFFGPAPLECGYRFFYLGQTNLRNINTQIMNHFSTGQSYANALLCTLTI
ncbi:TPA: hypothetical protein NR353_001583 [Legionella pneumophila]|uniref:Outer membrane protein beta-barrel domain-containing protein n=1 Tax=Legionella waltersii TaxID=66969 RepID=A0A0W1AGE3_9GAMM|nr:MULTISPECIES: hypothetical protein [Legionella]KTD80415.1 hypothetical protein Lwal_1112 [Legionella waltersii]MBN5936047.1 hypothetical protein [Legionella anisa]SNV10116.1 Uncharacterised protein [Legionella waltersii]HAT1129385.1 hypothetical protein [Legionella pneumophila]HAT1919928.1 hypothetical protein [Legionella pneumophila]